MTALAETAAIIAQRCRENKAGGIEQSQVYTLAEEAGEFVGAMRRWRGMARRDGTEAEAQNELADVVISAYVMADIMGWNLDELTTRKLATILTRGWKQRA